MFSIQDRKTSFTKDLYTWALPNPYFFPRTYKFFTELCFFFFFDLHMTLETTESVQLHVKEESMESVSAIFSNLTISKLQLVCFDHLYLVQLLIYLFFKLPS